MRRGTVLYNEKMEETCKGDAPLEETDFNNAHTNFSLEAKLAFDQSPKLGDEEISSRFAIDLENEIMVRNF